MFLFGLISLVSTLAFTQDALILLQQTSAQLNVSMDPDKSFHSAKDLFVTNDPGGYGIFQERDSNVFQPGETMILYIEPVGFAYKTVTNDQGEKLYSINFDASFTIYDADGAKLAGPVDTPIPPIISHYKNKEVFIPFTVTQSSPFPPGSYMIKYSIVDENSGNVFELNKSITISGNAGSNNPASTT
jgi:hypothetical protein